MSDFSSFATEFAPSSPTSLADHAAEFRQPAPTVQTQMEAPAKADLPWYERVIQGLKDPFNASAQLLMHSPIGKASMAVNKAITSGGGLFPNAVSESMGGAQQSLDASIQQGEQQYQAARGPNAGIDWARLGGNVANPINWIAPETGPAGLLANMGRGAAGAALSMPVTEGDYGAGLATTAGAGAVGGALLTPVGKALGRMVSPQTSDQVKTLLKAGVTPTPGQILGGAAQRMEDAATSFPILGDFIRNAQRRGIYDFNTAAYQRALDPIGEKAPQVIGREGVEAVADILGSKYDQILPKLSFRPDPQFALDLNNLKSMAAQLPEAQAKQFDNILASQFGKATPAGLMNGETLKGVTSTILQKAKGYSGDASFDNRELGSALMELKSTITRALQRQNPVEAPQLAAVDQGWANYARIRAAAASQGAHEGVFTPAQLSAAVKAGDKSVGKGNFAKGNALMQDLSDAGKSVLSQKVPDSGTILRGLVNAGLGGGAGYLATAHPLAVLGTIGAVGAGALPYTQMGQQAMSALFTKRPDMAPALAEAIRRGLPTLGGIGGAMAAKQ